MPNSTNFQTNLPNFTTVEGAQFDIALNAFTKPEGNFTLKAH